MLPALRLGDLGRACGALAAASLSPAQAADKVAVGTGGSAGDAPFYIAQDKGYFKNEGLDVDLIVLDSGAKVIAPLGTGELDVGSGALSVGFWNALLRGVKFRIVADRGHTEKGYLYQTVFMRKDLIDSGQFKSLKDLKGMRMGFAAQGVTSLSLLNEAAKFAGIRFEDVDPGLSLVSAADRGAAEQGARRQLLHRAAGDGRRQCRHRRALHGHQRVLPAPADLGDLLQRQVRERAQGGRGEIHARLAARRAHLQRHHRRRKDRGARLRRHRRRSWPGAST